MSFSVHKLRHLVGGKGEYVKRWRKMTNGGGVGVWNGLKKDDVIYEQPLIPYFLSFIPYPFSLIP